MNKLTRIISIGRDEFALPATITETEALKLLEILSKGLLEYGTGWVPDAHSEYNSAGYTKGQPIEVGLKITCSDVFTKAEFEERRVAGQAIYRAAHPEEKKALTS